VLRDSMRHHDNLCVGSRSGCKNRIALTLAGWFLTIMWEGASVLWEAVKSLGPIMGLQAVHDGEW